MPIAEILSQGDEVVTGQIADTNAAWLATRLTDLGFTVTRHTAVGDRAEDIKAALLEIGARADVCVGTGGLGPTDDDLTSRVVADAFDRPLEVDPEAMRQIEAMYARFQRQMPEINRRQAYLPGGSRRLDNAWGTAPGFAIESGRAFFAFLPGVPREMKPMFEERVLPLLQERFVLEAGRLVTIRTTGVGESDLNERIGAGKFFEDPDVTIGTRTILPENLVKLRFAAHVPEARVREVVDAIVARIGSPVFAIEGYPGGDHPLASPGAGSSGGVQVGGAGLAEVVGRTLLARGETMAVAESCTGGLVASQCTAIAGSSRWFLEGAVTYSNAAKVRVLGVAQAALDEHGAVSVEVCRQMAAGMRERSGATYALAITGVAGPGGGTEQKPVGMVHVALATPQDLHHRLLRLGGDRNRIQAMAAGGALDLLRRHLQNKL